jgi:hypothetical protein
MVFTKSLGDQWRVKSYLDSLKRSYSRYADTPLSVGARSG